MENIYTCFVPFYYFLKLVGGFPSSFDGPASKGNFKAKLIDALIPCVIFLTSILICGLVIFRGETVSSTSGILVQAWTYSLIFCLTLIQAGFAFQLYNHESIIKFIRKIDSIDKKVENLILMGPFTDHVDTWVG